eukprot:1161819-Pelagomonas_calceolata.AAC.4
MSATLLSCAALMCFCVCNTCCAHLQPDLSRREAQFTYADGDEYVFMDQETYEETRVKRDDWAEFLLEVGGGGTCYMSSADNMSTLSFNRDRSCNHALKIDVPCYNN